MSFDLASLSDGELVSLTLGGRKTAFSEIMRRHRDPIFRLARAHSGDAEEALDITQDCFAAAYRNLARYDPGRSLRAWLSRIAINRSRDWRRRRRVRAILSYASSLPRGQMEAIEDQAADTEMMVSDKAQLELARRAIADLPAKLRDVLLLRTIEGLSQAETADALGISGKAVETRLHRARARLGEVFSRF